MSDDLASYLISFAQDQLRVIRGWQGQYYVNQCLALWQQEYGAKVTNKVRDAINTRK